MTMPAGLFISSYINKIDKKGRVSVPASFRALLASDDAAVPATHGGVVAFRSYRAPALECCNLSYLERMTHRITEGGLFAAPYDDVAETVFADAQLLPFDSEGRIFIPEIFRDFCVTNINPPDALPSDTAVSEQALAFVGRGHTFQIWNPKTFQEHQALARAKLQAQIREHPVSRINHPLATSIASLKEGA